MHLGVLNIVFIVVAMSLAPLQGHAQSETTGENKTSGTVETIVPAVKPTGRLPHKSIYPGDALYPVELANSGVQGEVKIEVRLSGEGKLLSAKIIGSSLSAELDKNALAYANLETWRLPEDNSKVSETYYQQSVIFSRDSVLTINLKTCTELNSDLIYFRTVRPSEPAKNLQSLELIASVFTVQLIKTQGAAEALKYAKSLDAISEDTIRICTEKPDARLMETYVKTAKSYKIRF